MSGRKPALATWPEPNDEPEQTDEDLLDLWGGDDHSQEDMQRVREVIHSPSDQD